MVTQKFSQSLPQLVIIGHVAYDQTTYANGEQSHFFPSGAAYFGAVGASLYNKNIGIVSRVGSDYDMQLLTRLEIDLEGVKCVPGGKTTRFYFTYNSDMKKRTFRSEFNVNTNLSPSDIPPGYLQANHIHIAPMPPHKQRVFVEFLKKKSNATLSIDTIEQFVERWPQRAFRVIQQVHMVFMNRKKLAILKRNGLHTAISSKELILKLGAKGATYIHGKERITVPAPHAQTIVDKSGTGDVLAGVFLALITQGVDKQSALQKAAQAASKSLKGYGVESLLSSTMGPGIKVVI